MDFDLYDDLLVGEEERPPTEKEKLLMEENETLKVSSTLCDVINDEPNFYRQMH
jgi:hypothetical protein